MPVITLVPQAEIAFPAPWTVVGAASSVLALSDDSDSSYIDRVGAGFATAKWDLSSALLAANQRVNALRIRAAVLNGSGVQWLDVYQSDGTTNRVHRILSWSPCYPYVANDCDPGIAPFPPAIYYSEWWPGAFNGGTTSEITQSVLDGLQLWTSLQTPSAVNFQLSSLSVEVDVRTRPSVVVNPAAGTTSSTLVTWLPTLNDGDRQSAWQLAVFTEAQYLAVGFDPASSQAVYRASGVGTSASALVLQPLDTQTNYRAYVRVAKTIFCGSTDLLTTDQQAGTNWYSDWGFAAIAVSEVETANYAGPISEGELGCHEWRVTLQARGGGRVLAEVPWSTIDWGRVVDDMSTAEVSFPYAYCTVDRTLADARAWEHEIGIWRDSADGWQLEWVGPIVGRHVSRTSVTLRAKDLFVWMEHRRIHGDYTLVDIDLSTMFAGFMLDALGPDTSPNIDVQPRLSGTLGTRTILGSQKQRAADQLRDLARGGVDFTVIGRTVLIAGNELPLDPLVTLIDEHTTGPEFDESGEQAATDIAIVGKLVDTDQILGSASDDTLTDTFGLLETTITSNDIETTSLADFVASQNLDLLGVIPEDWSVTLRQDSPNGYAALVPGARWPVNLVSLGKLGTYRFKALSVKISRTEAAVAEEVTVTLISLGASEDTE